MKIINNEKLIKRNQRIAKYAMNGTFVLLIAYTALFIFSFNKPNLMMWSLVAVLPALILSQVAGYYGARFGRSPRPDEEIVQALKGLDDKYCLYNYSTPVSHLLVGPPGVWVVLPYYQNGTIRYDEKRKRWIQSGGSTFMKIFGQGGLGRPDMEIRVAIEDMTKFLKNNLNEIDLPAVKAALIFTSEKAIVEAANAPVPTLHASKFKDFIRRKAKEEPAPTEAIRLLQKELPSGKETQDNRN